MEAQERKQYYTNRHAHATVLTPHALCCTRPSHSDRCRVIWPPAPTHRLRCYILHYCAAGPSGCATPVSRPDQARETESCNSLVATPPSRCCLINALGCQLAHVNAGPSNRGASDVEPGSSVYPARVPGGQGHRVAVIRAHELLHIRLFIPRLGGYLARSLTISYLHISSSPGQWQPSMIEGGVSDSRGT
jgi:hypothetical protein